MSEKFKEIINSERPVLIDFFAAWCQPCKIQSSVLNSVKENVGEKARIVKVDIQNYPQIAAEYGVRSVPTLLIFKNGKILWRGNGLHDVNTLVHLLEGYK